MTLPANPVPPKRRCVMVCLNRSCARSGSEEVLAAFKAAVPPNVFVSGSDCMGQCGAGPMVQVMPDGTWYCQVKVADVPLVVEQHLLQDQPVKKLLHSRFHPQNDVSMPASSQEIE